jgi:iron complex outermembrane receptor protein
MLRATAARRTRFPSLKERFSSAFGLREPNPGLRPESAWHFGLDAAYRLAPWLRAEAAVYDAEVSALIDDVVLGGGKDQLQNIGTARLLGAEGFLTARAGRLLEVRAGYNWLHARRTDAGPNDQLAYRPEHRAILSAVVRPTDWLDLWGLLRVIGPQDYQDPVTLTWGRLGPYAVLDVRVEVRPIRRLALWVRATNLLDANYVTEIGYPDPGREIWFGLKIMED